MIFAKGDKVKLKNGRRSSRGYTYDPKEIYEVIEASGPAKYTNGSLSEYNNITLRDAWGFDMAAWSDAFVLAGYCDDDYPIF